MLLKKKWTRLLASVLATLMLILPISALADQESGRSFTCYGDDLTSDQYASVLEMLGTDKNSDELIPVTIQDEHALLKGVVDEKKMGTRSLSSARVTLTQSGSGITVTTKNINWVTASMYSAALATAGVENATIIVAAPFEVSGTAALAGILKAYESAMGTELSSLAKAVAGNEMVLTGELAQLIGSDQAVELLAMIKKEIAEKGLDNPENLRPYVVEAAKQLGVGLSDTDIDAITALGVKLAKLDLDPEKLSDQLNNIVGGIQKMQDAQQKTASFFSSVSTAVKGFFDWIGGWFKK